MAFRKSLAKFCVVQHDTQLVSLLYRTHRSCKAQYKINSLYVIDSLARAAQRYAEKHNQKADADSSRSNCATFLVKLQAVLDGVFQEMLSSDVPEGKVSCTLTKFVLCHVADAGILHLVEPIYNVLAWTSCSVGPTQYPRSHNSSFNLNNVTGLRPLTCSTRVSPVDACGDVLGMQQIRERARDVNFTCSIT